MKIAALILALAVASPVLAKGGGGGGGHGGGGHGGGHATAHATASHATVAPSAHATPTAKSSSGSLFGGWSFFGSSRPAPVVAGRSTSSCKDQQGNPCK